MERLRDQARSGDRVIARAAELLSSVPPIASTRRPPPLREPAVRRGPPLQFRMAFVVAVLLLTAAAAAATMRVWPMYRVAPGAAPPPAPASDLRQPESKSHAFAGSAPLVAAEGGAVAVEDTTPDTTRALPAQASRPPSTTANAQAPPAEDESTLMVRAVRALRREGDPARAQALAEQALARFPAGAQTEEAMALVMEAASDRGDVSSARRAASAYLARFPSGRFVDRAARILGSPPR